MEYSIHIFLYIAELVILVVPIAFLFQWRKQIWQEKGFLWNLSLFLIIVMISVLYETILFYRGIILDKESNQVLMMFFYLSWILCKVVWLNGQKSIYVSRASLLLNKVNGLFFISYITAWIIVAVTSLEYVQIKDIFNLIQSVMITCNLAIAIFALVRKQAEKKKLIFNIMISGLFFLYNVVYANVFAYLYTNGLRQMGDLETWIAWFAIELVCAFFVFKFTNGKAIKREENKGEKIDKVLNALQIQYALTTRETAMLK